jgi:ABC-2 type transport system permease protein
MLFYPNRISPYLVLIPVIAAVQFVFTLGCAYLLAAGNVFFRDLGNVEGHVLRLIWFLSPGLYSLAVLDQLHIFTAYPALRTVAEANPFAILFTAYRTVIYGTADTPPGLPNFLSLFALLIASIVLLAVATVVFKRLEPNFAKVV